VDQPTRRFDTPPDEPDSGDTRRLDAPPESAPPRSRIVPAACAKCGGTMMEVLVDATQGSIQLKRSDVWLGWMGGTSELVAQVCTSCGYVELYAASLDYLLQK
jgi:hypothetical protein